MRLRIAVLSLLLVALVGPAAVMARGPGGAEAPLVDAPLILAQQGRMDGTCVALDPAVVRPLLRDEMCAFFCLEPQSADAAPGPSTVVLRRSPLANRTAAAEELLLDVPIMDTDAAAAAIPGLAERYGLDELALREAVGLARERALMRMRDEGMLEEANAACLLLRTRNAFRLCYQEPPSAP